MTTSTSNAQRDQSFAERVISAKRPDRPNYPASLRLQPDAGPWAILSASGGYREGDDVEVISMPTSMTVTRCTPGLGMSAGTSQWRK
ncbi:hypothetical protein [Mycobacterium sp.]|uniref:hypothetical protein n=1 Tax=Mycobacterium sp. TaxID=1785 RepID=UPI003C71E6DC